MVAKKRAPGGGRKRIPIPWPEIKKFCAIHATAREISAYFEISQDVLSRRSKEAYGKQFAELIDEWASYGNCSLRRAQWVLATDKLNPTMLIWLGKQYLGQREPEREEDKDSYIKFIDPTV